MRLDKSLFAQQFSNLSFTYQHTMRLSLTLCFAGVAFANGLSSDSGSNNFTVALVRAPPANYPYPPPSLDWKGLKHDLNASVELGVQYIEQAASQGADLVAFPELWFPG